MGHPVGCLGDEDMWFVQVCQKSWDCPQKYLEFCSVPFFQRHSSSAHGRFVQKPSEVQRPRPPRISTPRDARQRPTLPGLARTEYTISSRALQQHLHHVDTFSAKLQAGVSPTGTRHAESQCGWSKTWVFNHFPKCFRYFLCGIAGGSVSDESFVCRVAVWRTEVRTQGRQGRIWIWLPACGWLGSAHVICLSAFEKKTYNAAELPRRHAFPENNLMISVFPDKMHGSP